MIRIATSIVLLALAGQALAQEQAVETIATVPTMPPTAAVALTLNLQSTTDIEQTSVVYQCDSGEVLSVQYVNAAPNFLALVPVENEVHVFVTTISGSGARYVSGPFEWWSRGDEATLADLTQGEDADPLATCTAASNTP